MSYITPETIGGGVVSIGLLWLSFSKLLLKTTVDKTSKTATEAESSVIDMLREEVERMAASNKQLGESLRQFQLENIELRTEISHLHETINSLTERLNIMDRARENCNGCEHNIFPLLERRKAARSDD